MAPSLGGIQRYCVHIDENGLEATTAEGAHAIINAECAMQTAVPALRYAPIS